MGRMIFVCGPTGVGKTTYSISISKKMEGIRFSIDPWIQTHYAKDMKSLDYEWMIERVNRCYEQIWDVSKQILALDGNVVLDLGFTEKSQRDVFSDRGIALGITSEVHFLDAPLETRKMRVEKRNSAKDPKVYAFEVTEFMIDFMESRFKAPDDEELKSGLKIDTSLWSLPIADI
jgi:predicted kinase